MAKVRSLGNMSTEQTVEKGLVTRRIRGWVKHPKDIVGRPDFYFPRYRLAVFVDGCFWHACPTCKRRTPRTRSRFWAKKISANRQRDLRIRRRLWALGFHSMRIWEHDLKKDKWTGRLVRMLSRIADNA